MGPLLETVILVGAIAITIRAVIRYRSARPNDRNRWAPAGILGMANFALLFLVTVVIGGMAFGGRVVDGRYFVSSHGPLKEVPGWVWIFNWIQTVSQVATFPLILVWWFTEREAIEDEKPPSTDVRGRGAA